MAEALNKARAEYERAREAERKMEPIWDKARKGYLNALVTFNLAEAALKEIESTFSAPPPLYTACSAEDIVARILRDIDTLIEIAQQKQSGIAMLRLELARDQITKVCISQ